MGTHLHRCVPIFFHQTDQNMYPFPSIVIKEESDTILASQFDVKKLGGPIALVAKRWFVEQLNAAAMQ